MQAVFLLIILIIAILATYYAIVGGIKMLRFFMFLVVFQNVIAISFSRYIPASYNTLFSMIKEMMLYLSLVPAIMRRKSIKYSSKKAVYYIGLIVYILLLTKNFIFTPARLSSAILSLRYMLVPVLCIYVGKTVKLSQKQTIKLMYEIVGWSLFLALFGFIELIFLKDRFWTALGYSDYAVRMKGNEPWALFNGVTVNFYTWDFFGVPIRRLVSITADPLATAYLVYLGSMILFTGSVRMRKRKNNSVKFLVLVLLFIASILSLSKAVFIMMIITVLICAYFYKWLPKSMLKLLVVFGGLFMVLILRKYLSGLSQASSISNHLLGLQIALSDLGLLGNGLGTAGSSVVMLTGAESDVVESYMGSMLSQLGFVGTISFLIILYFQVKDLVNYYRHIKNAFSVLALCSLIGVIICMVFSDSSVSIMGTGLHFIIIGIALRQKEQGVLLAV